MDVSVSNPPTTRPKTVCFPSKCRHDRNVIKLQNTGILHLFTQRSIITPWNGVLLEKLIGSQLVKKYPISHGIRRLISAFTSAHHLSLSSARSIQSMPPHHTSWISILILSSHLCLGIPSGLLPSGFPTKTLYTPLLYPHMLHAPPISLFWILSPERYWVRSIDN